MTISKMYWIVTLAFVFTIIAANVKAELTPPYFNLAEGRKISATATCGVDTDGPELYCKLVGANTEKDNQFPSVIQAGQVCDYCDPTRADRRHPPEYAIDGTENWWQSPPLSRGMKYNEVNLTIDFGQEFHVAYLYIRMANSPRPGLWTLEKSVDYGKTWKAWQHFSDTPSDCETYFGRESLKPITADDDVICTTDYSKIVPLEGGEIPVMLLNNRPSANNYFNSTVLQEWTRATNVRFRFLRTKNLLGHLMSVQRQDPTVTRRYFYSIKDISIGGRCMCNGHADTCHVHEPSPTRILACQCQHDTCGIQCNECCPGFEQKKWRQNTKSNPFKCEPCNCFGHSRKCIYDESIDKQGLSLDILGRYEGGGVCQECEHNTEGINCNKCKAKYYRPYGKHWNETDVCRPCDCDNFYSTGSCEEESGRCECRPEFEAPHCQSCSFGHFGYPNCRACECNLNGTDGYFCESSNGNCPCKTNFGGPLCKVCADGYYDFPECKACECNSLGSVNNNCNLTSGVCLCSSNFDGKQCDQCKDGYFNYPDCSYCNCDLQGTIAGVCEKQTGQCLCREGYGGPRCDKCLPGFYNYPDCIPCNCSILGSVSTICDASGKCPCLASFAGKQCGQCSTGYYAYPECLPCNCGTHGSVGISCNSEGQCLCSSNFDGKNCNQCKEGFYNYPSCEECNCDPAGVIAKFAGCGSVPAGELCECKERVTGRICNECKPLYWNLNLTNFDGCEECDCFIDGTIGALDTCDGKSGQCSCKPSVRGRSCNECKDGSFDLFGGSLFGCKDCGCDIGGSIHPICNKATGQCKCHARIAGRTCTHPITTHYFPTLFQNQFEFEDGYTPSGANVRYLFDEEQFPEFSKRGYAKFSNIQSEVINEVTIMKSSVYRMIIRFVNPSDENIVAQILITSDNPNESDQSAKVLLTPTKSPQFVTVSGAKGEIPSPIVLDPGRYSISVKTDKYLFLDYFVLLPAAYYESTILTKKIENPCEIDNLALCRHYKYPSIAEYVPTIDPFIMEDDNPKKAREHYTDFDHLSLIHENNMPALTETQSTLNYILNIPKAGRYIVVVDYITDRKIPETSIIRINLGGEEDKDGVVTLYPCTYTMVCRQPVIDAESREKVFVMDDKDLRPIEIVGDGEASVAIKSVSAIPIEDWSIDFITPNSVCIMRDGKCVAATYQSAPDSKKIEFEHDHEDNIAEENPSDLYDTNSTKLIYLDVDYSTWEIRSKVPSPGRYHIIVKFFQPNHPQFNLIYRINTDKSIHDGKLPLKNCPSNSGCRELIKQDNGYTWFDIEEGITITLTNNVPKRGVWLDYILLVPSEEFTDNLLQEETFDQTKEFIQQCGHDHFHVQLNASEFCKQAVFSLASDYNHGALPCMCDYAGSTSFECDPFGGQCQCKKNVIGRQCDACRTGFYGFPNCKPCDCPSTALCERDTGECICPPRVTGEKCDKCEPYTFGFDQIIGCELCNCNPMGVEYGNLQCDLNNGTCNCRTHIEGRTCDKCLNGFHNFPHCEPCRCTKEGTTFDICDQQDETCFCKKNVQGVACDTCVDGTYNLQQSNPEGCTKCFCFGKTSRCDRAYLRPFIVSMMKELSLNSINVSADVAEISRWPLMSKEIFVNDTTVQVDFRQKESDDELVYFGMVDYLLDQNNHLTAYGGQLTYTLYYTTGVFGKALIGADVILEGKDIVIVHQNYEQPANAQIFLGSVKMVESNFQSISGAPVSREQFMTVLRNLNSIFIRATYWQGTIISQISDIYLTMADEDEENYNLYEELSVEKCHCPIGYQGYSCENCAPGYYRDPSGPYGGYCVPCQCNGHADTCDCDTGICNECKHFTTGNHCDKCIVGYHGDATHGTPHDCMICACPLPIESNNFADSCEISEDGYKIHCSCREGYTGGRCQSCAAGYYGQPEKENEFCKPCECSGNINTHEAEACDSVTGECLRCLNNTYGTACNLCKPGYFGDAIKLKDCQSCICDLLGTEHCDSFVGTCHCHENVIGDKCDRCEEDHYGFDSGLGCKSCDCAVASNSTQCDDHSGDCRCKPGVTGRQCDRCLPGYWNYTSEGCLPCSCNTDYSRGLGCNAQTGQCECLPGVVGEKCDACPHRWVLVPDTGCHVCDICHHALLDVTDAMHNDLDPVIEEFKTVAGGYFTAQKLKYYDELVDKLVPEVTSLDPNGINLTPSMNLVDAIELDAKNMNRRVQFSEQRAKELADNGVKLTNSSSDVLDNSRFVLNNVKNTISEVEKLADSFDASESTKVDNAIAEASETLQLIQNHMNDSSPTNKHLEDAENHLMNIERFSKPVKQQNLKLDDLRHQIGLFSDKMEDLFDWSVASNEKSLKAQILQNKNQATVLNLKFDTVANQSKDAWKNINGTDLFGKKGDVTMGEIYRHLKSLENVNNELKEVCQEVDKKLPQQDEDLQKLNSITELAQQNQNKLVHTAKNLSLQLSVTADWEKALKAANSYTDIVEAVQAAQNEVRNAKMVAGNATQLTYGIEDRAGAGDQVARDMLNEARIALNTVQLDLQPHLNKSSQDVDNIYEKNNLSDDQTTAINIALDLIKPDSQAEIWQEARDNAISAQEKAQEALNILKPIIKGLPSELNRAKQMPKEVDDTNKDIAQASKQVERVMNLFPNLQALVNDLGERQEKTTKTGNDLADRIERLKKQIEMARDVANSIKVGVNFHPNTTLELRPPSNLNQLATTSRVSAFVKTDKPNGFLLYLGNENKPGPRRNKRDDFMALEVENGYPIVTIDLGNGPERIVSNKYIANGEWHQVIVERTGNDVKLIVREEIADGKDQLHEVVGSVPGPDSVFNVDAENSKLFVGGFPPDFNIQDGLKYSSFEGQIEDLRIGDQEAGLWNFVDGQDNNHGALERDRLMAAEVPATGYRFSGQGYVILDSKPYMFKQRSSVQFKFKVGRDVTEGLIFYAGKHRHFISVEMRRGGIYFQYKLGQHMVAIGSSEMFNDDQWHRVEAEREGRKGILKVDGNVIYQEETPIDTEENLKISDSLYFGGVPHKINHTEITTKNFDGCIDDVFISGSPVDLSKHLKAYGVRPGCPMKFSSGLSFSPHSPGYLRLGNITASNHFQINMKFKTNSPNGLIFYATNHDQSATIGLALRDGSLVFSSGEKELSSGSNKYDTGEWNVVTATHDQKKLRMYVGDNEYISEFDTDALYIEHGDIYYGGLPSGYKTPKNVLGSTENFVGCISDVTIRGQVVNFANSTDKKAADLDNCSRDIFGVDGYVPTKPNGNVIEGKEVEINVPGVSTAREEDRRRQEEEVRRQQEEERRRQQEEERLRQQEEERRRQQEEDRLRQQEEERRRQQEEEEDRRRKQEEIDEEERRRLDKLNEIVPETTTVPPEITQRTTRRRPTQDKVEPICKLPVEPEVDVDFDAGYRFGTSTDSRVEFTQIPSKIKRSYDISLQFKTTSPDGVLFYAADSRHTDFIALYLQGGKLVHAFNCGSGSARMVSQKEYNNGVWHTVVFSRQQAKGKLLINGEDEQFGESVGNTRSMAVQPPYSIGGINPDSMEDMNVNLKMTKGQYFSGCIRNVQIGGKGLGVPEQTFGVIPCSEQIEEGMFFGKGGGYVKLRDRFKVGTELTISFDIKSRTLNGLLLSVHGKKAYLILQLINGTINFTVDNGDGPIVAVFKPDANENFCDGNWHSVTAIKSKYVITLMVNRVSSQPSIGNANSPSTDTSRPLFMGGHPHLMKARGLSIRKPYLGCIRNVRIRDVAEEVQPTMMVGNVQAGVCPTN